MRTTKGQQSPSSKLTRRRRAWRTQVARGGVRTGKQHRIPGTETSACCELALLPRGCADAALLAFTEHENRLEAEERREARWLLWRATGGEMHLDEAKRLLDSALALVPDEYHESMLTNVRVNREIMAAWKSESGTSDDHGDDDPYGDEAVTRLE